VGLNDLDFDLLDGALSINSATSKLFAYSSASACSRCMFLATQLTKLEPTYSDYQRLDSFETLKKITKARNPLTAASVT
jgi:hypothetical protein